MTSKTRLYDAFGELIYAVALADGLIQQEELDKIDEVLKNHPWGKDVKWSFDYEARKGNDPKDAFEKALDLFKENGPDPDYYNLIDIIERIAVSSQGMDTDEKEVIEGFQTSLRNHFLEFLDQNGLMKT
ncbi:MAG: TerB family tellurite resistance protein [Bacteroidetes bacterium]|nr:TerB family tellurite resistance protein [Bacteroidota bacterium]